MEALEVENLSAAAALGQHADQIIQEGMGQIADVRRNIEEAGGTVSDREGGTGTVSVVEANGQVFFGLNGDNYPSDSHERSYTQQFQKDNFKLKKGQNQFLYHAEAQSLLRLAEALGDQIPAELVLHVDRKTCGQCRKFLPRLAAKLGIRRLTIIVAGGQCGVLENGEWTWVYSDAESEAETGSESE